MPQHSKSNNFNTIKHIARILLGITFIFSGFVKGIDPLGSTYKFIDYFEVMQLDFLNSFAFSLSILQSFIEFAIGIAFVFNWRMRLFSWFGLLFMVFYTPITLWIALKNPVTDCGCFGDALVISNWETFYKNLFLLLIAILVFVNRNWFAIQVKSHFPVTISSLLCIIYLGVVYYSYNHLPIIDFRPYKIGTNIPEAMKIPANAPQDIYETTFEYKNKQTDEVKTFTDKNYPWQDSLHWEYVSTGSSRLIQKGYRPPIHDFTMEDENSEDIKDFFLYDEGYTFIVIAYDLKKANQKTMPAINKLANYANENNINFIGLTASIRNNIEIFAQESNTSFEFFNCDEITLKTIIRSNPGLILLKKGIIIGKWHFNDIPDKKEIEQIIK